MAFILFFSCKESEKEYHYKSDDWATGGFVEYKLDFIKNGKCRVEFIKQIISDTDSLSHWIPKSFMINGNWHLSEGKIFFKFNDFQIIEDAFLKNKFVTTGLKLNSNNELVMDANTDTVYIDNFPCLKFIEAKK